MAQGRTSRMAADAFLTLCQATARADGQGPSVVISVQIVSLLGTAREQREFRLFQMTQGVPAPLWLLLVLLSLVLGSFATMARSSILLVAISGLSGRALASILVMVRLLDFSFAYAGHSAECFAETCRRCNCWPGLGGGRSRVAPPNAVPPRPPPFRPQRAASGGLAWNGPRGTGSVPLHQGRGALAHKQEKAGNEDRAGRDRR